MIRDNVSTLDLARTIAAAQYALLAARSLIYDAELAKDRSDAQGCRHFLTLARGLIADARRVYADVMLKLAKRKQLSHHATMIQDASRRFRAAIHCEVTGSRVWLSARSYGKRQSAQHAAERYVFKLRLAAY